MTFSIGQNFFNELLESGNKIAHNNDKKSLSVTYELQKRMATYWKNNDKPVLLKSKQHSGMTDLLGHSEPLGGSINWQRCGTDNAVGSCIHGCPDEYPFWGTTKENKIENEKDKKENFENINEALNESGHRLECQSNIVENSQKMIDQISAKILRRSQDLTIRCVVARIDGRERFRSDGS